jgi:vacuolar-type H+-ATPase subunit H
MKNNKPLESPDAEQAIQQVLQAERDAERSIQACEAEARMIVHKAQGRAQRINARADERITNMEMRHGHKLDRVIKDIERDGADALRLDAAQRYDDARMQAVIDALAKELCLREVSKDA